jgi:hypothetical protein
VFGQWPIRLPKKSSLPVKFISPNAESRSHRRERRKNLEQEHGVETTDNPRSLHTDNTYMHDLTRFFFKRIKEFTRTALLSTTIAQQACSLLNSTQMTFCTWHTSSAFTDLVKYKILKVNARLLSIFINNGNHNFIEIKIYPYVISRYNVMFLCESVYFQLLLLIFFCKSCLCNRLIRLSNSISGWFCNAFKLIHKFIRINHPRHVFVISNRKEVKKKVRKENRRRETARQGSTSVFVLPLSESQPRRGLTTSSMKREKKHTRPLSVGAPL